MPLTVTSNDTQKKSTLTARGGIKVQEAHVQGMGSPIRHYFPTKCSEVELRAECEPGARGQVLGRVEGLCGPLGHRSMNHRDTG